MLIARSVSIPIACSVLEARQSLVAADRRLLRFKGSCRNCCDRIAYMARAHPCWIGEPILGIVEDRHTGHPDLGARLTPLPRPPAQTSDGLTCQIEIYKSIEMTYLRAFVRANRVDSQDQLQSSIKVRIQTVTSPKLASSFASPCTPSQASSLAALVT